MWFVSIETIPQRDDLSCLRTKDKAEDIQRIPLGLFNLRDSYKGRKSSDIACLLRQLGLTEIFTNGSGLPPYDSAKVAENLVKNGYFDFTITPNQAKWFVDSLLTIVSQSFEQENGDDQEARQLLDIILNRIQGNKAIILRNGKARNGKAELATYKLSFFDWIIIACKLGEIPLSPEQEQILKKYLESRATSCLAKLNYARVLLR